MASVRVGLVGVGDAGRHHGRALAALSAAGVLRWSAICARDPERLAKFRAEVGAPADAASSVGLDALLDARACNAVVLATPDGLHAEQVERCADRGVHVLVEKPLALTIADGARAAARSREAGVVLAVGYHLRHHAGHRALRALVSEGRLGALRQIHVRWAWPDPATTGWRARGDGARFWCLAALGTHGIDLARWIAGAPIASSEALLERSGAVDVAAEISLRLEGGVLAHVSSSVTHRAIARVVVTGDRGEIEGLGTLGARGGGAITFRALGQEPEPVPFAPEDPYLAQMRAFVATIEGRGNNDDDLAAALENLEVLERAGRHLAKAGDP